MRSLYVRTYYYLFCVLRPTCECSSTFVGGVVQESEWQSRAQGIKAINWIGRILFSILNFRLVNVCTVRIFVCLFVCCCSCFCSIVRCISLRNIGWVYCWLIANKPALSVRVVELIFGIFFDRFIFESCANKSRIKRLKQLWNNIVRLRVRMFSLNHHGYVASALVMCHYWTIVNKFLKWMCCCWWIHLVILKCLCMSHVWMVLPLASSDDWIYTFNTHSKSSKQQFSPLLCQHFNNLNCSALRHAHIRIE